MDRSPPSRSFAAVSRQAVCVLLPLLALIAVLLAPLALVLHESMEAHHDAAHAIDSHGADSHGADSHWVDAALAHPVPSHPAHEPIHHDAAHCVTCLTIGGLNHAVFSAAFVLALTDEPAPQFVIPSYLAPTTHEPAIALVIPRGPPERA